MLTREFALSNLREFKWTIHGFIARALWAGTNPQGAGRSEYF
jgi:hypothetical protein